MDSQSDQGRIDLIHVVVNSGTGSKALHIAKSVGVTGGTVYLGKGTAHNHILELLGLAQSPKEIVLMVAPEHVAQKAMTKLNDELKLKKPTHGIAFTTSVRSVIGTRSMVYNRLFEEERGEEVMHKLINVVVEKGRAEEVIDAAAHAGAKGGTIINARGSGAHETERIFMMDIEPEKELVIIIAKTEAAPGIVEAIAQALDLKEPGKGILFVQNIDNIHGLAE